MNNINWWLLLTILWGLPAVINSVGVGLLRDWKTPMSTRELMAVFIPGYNIFVLGVFCLMMAYGYARNKDKWKKV